MRGGIPGYRAAPSSGLLATAIDILEADDVVLAEVAAGLHLDEFERDLARIGEPVNGADRDIGGLVLVQDLLVVADGDFRGAPHHHPMLRAVEMLLQGQGPARSNDEALDLKALAGVDRLVVTPRPIDPP